MKKERYTCSDNGKIVVPWKLFPADTALEQFSMAVPHHVRLELRLVRELDPAHAADQSFAGSQRLYVLLEIHIFVQIHLLLDRGATPPLLPPLVPLPPRLDLVSVVDVELVVRREILDLVEHLGLDFHLGQAGEESRIWFSYLRSERAKFPSARRNERSDDSVLNYVKRNETKRNERKEGGGKKKREKLERG